MIALDRMEHLKELRDKIAFSSQRNLSLLVKLQFGFIKSCLCVDRIHFLPLLQKMQWFESSLWILISRQTSILKIPSPVFAAWPVL